jgi:hypothetical protein
MINPPLARLQEPRGQLKRFTAQERLAALRQEASAPEIPDGDFLDRLLTEEVTAKGEQ